MPDNSLTENKPTGVQPYKNREFDAYISWRALGGLIIDEDSSVSPTFGRIMTLKEFCLTYKIDPKTIYNWKTQTPNLAELIEQRRNEIVPLSRVSAVWNQLYLTAMQSSDKRAAVEAQKVFLGHFGNLQLPVQRQDVKVQHSLAEIFSSAEREFIEGEVTDANRPTGSLPDSPTVA